MKKIILPLLAIATLSLTGCTDLNCNYKKVHVFNDYHCYVIDGWREYSDRDQILVEIRGYGKVLFHANQIALIEDNCPFCDK